MIGATNSLMDRRVRLHVVTGKGGTGKSTVAGALAVTLASQGHKVLLAEVEGRGAIASVFDVAPLGEETPLMKVGTGTVHGLSIDAREALIEYLRTFYRLGPAGAVLEKMGAIDFATTVAPGVRDLLLIGKVYEAVRRRASGRHRPTSKNSAGESGRLYDAVVLDAPPTGRVVQFLNVGAAVGDLARMGPVHHQSRAIMELLRSAATAVHLVALPEEMPVQETIDTVAELRADSLPVGSILVNQAAADLLTPATAVALQAGRISTGSVAADLRALGLAADEKTAQGLVQQGLRHVDRLHREDAMIDRLDALGRPVLLLPRLLDPKGAAGLRRLAGEITAQVAA